MQSYDVRYMELYDIKSQNSYTWHISLLPGEGVAGLGGVQVIYVGRRVIITSAEPTFRSWGYHIDYDVDGNVMSPVMPEELEQMIGDLTKIGCCEYTPDLLRAINRSRSNMDEYREKTDKKLKKIIKKLRL